MPEPEWNIPEYHVHPSALSDAMQSLPWSVENFGIPEHIWGHVSGNQLVGVIDTGVSKTHVDAGELTGMVAEAADFTGSRNGQWDYNGHGSHVNGTICAKSFGIAKECAKLLSAKALGDSGSGSDRSIANAIAWCVNRGAMILNLSLGSNVPSPMINGILREVSQQGVICVCAAGNSGGPVENPAKEPYVLAVTAIDENMRLCSFSSRGDEADVTAPGGMILSLARGGAYQVLSGTSMASPWVAAFLACKRALDISRGVQPIKNVDQAIDWLTSSSTDLGAPGRDWMFGVGMPDPSKLIGVPPVLPMPPGSTPGVGIVVDILETGERWAPTGWAKI